MGEADCNGLFRKISAGWFFLFSITPLLFQYPTVGILFILGGFFIRITIGFAKI